jgi:alpha-ketoglutarate-dependent taurine dioxygenase
MLNEVVTGPRAWRADSIDASARWYHRLSDRCADALRRAARERLGAATDLRPDEALREACAAELRSVLDALEDGRGFAIIPGLPGADGDPDEARAAYWLLGRLLAEPVAQNVEGTLLYDVRDTGQDVARGARFSVTNYESSFHTDNSFGDAVLDYVGLLCLRPARSGGTSQVVSGCAVHNVLLRECPDVLPLLYSPFEVERRGGVRPGEAPTARVPVIAWDGRGLLFRYLRYWIEAGHERAGRRLTPAQRDALDTLDAALARPELRAEFRLRPGDVFVMNNRWLLHNRTAFEDHPEPGRRRHLVRLWLRRPG